MVGATLSHLRALRLMQDDRGWMRTLMDEAHHRDTNHFMANTLSGKDANHMAIIACPPHVPLDPGLR